MNGTHLVIFVLYWQMWLACVPVHDRWMMRSTDPGSHREFSTLYAIVTPSSRWYSLSLHPCIPSTNRPGVVFA